MRTPELLHWASLWLYHEELKISAKLSGRLLLKKKSLTLGPIRSLEVISEPVGPPCWFSLTAKPSLLSRGSQRIGSLEFPWDYHLRPETASVHLSDALAETARRLYYVSKLRKAPNDFVINGNELDSYFMIGILLIVTMSL